jgi:hypothetical protein
MPGLWSGSVLVWGDGGRVSIVFTGFVSGTYSCTVSGDRSFPGKKFIWSRSYLIWQLFLKKIVTRT